MQGVHARGPRQGGQAGGSSTHFEYVDKAGPIAGQVVTLDGVHEGAATEDAAKEGQSQNHLLSCITNHAASA